MRAAWRRKVLEPVGLPLSVIALDVKIAALPCLNQPSAALVSRTGAPCIDAIPIPASTNRVGHFQAAFKNLLRPGLLVL